MKDQNQTDLPEGAAPLLQSALTADRVRILARATKKEVIAQLVQMLADGGMVSSAEKLSDAVWAREKLMSTGIGLALAIPHARLNAVKQIAAAAVLVTGGVPDYESLDNVPVKLVVMIVAREGEHAKHLRLLSQLSTRLKHDSAAGRILHAATEPELLHLLTGE